MQNHHFFLRSESDLIKLAPFPWIVFSNPPDHPVLSTSPTAPSGTTHLSSHSLAPFTLFALLFVAYSTCSEVPVEVYRNLDGIGGDDDKWWEVIPLRF